MAYRVYIYHLTEEKITLMYKINTLIDRFTLNATVFQFILLFYSRKGDIFKYRHKHAWFCFFANIQGIEMIRFV